jgi:virginiamycin B lyase
LRGCVGLAAISILCVLTVAGCGNGTVIGSGPLPTPSPVAPHITNEFKVPTANGGPVAIARGFDGFLYFTEQTASKIGQMTTGGSFSEISTKTPAAAPLGIIAGANTLIWFTEPAVHKIATITSFSGTPPITEYTVPWANAAPAFLANGPLQNTMYFTDPANSAIGEITTTGAFTGPFPTITAGANPLGIALGPDNNMWFCENGVNRIGHLNTATNTVDREFALSTGARPVDIIVASDGAMWFTENNPAGPKLGRLTTTGVLNEYALTGAKSASGMSLNLFGNIDIADAANNAIGEFNPNSLTYKEVPITTGSANPTSLTIGPDGKIYFTEFSADQIGQYTYF